MTLTLLFNQGQLVTASNIIQNVLVQPITTDAASIYISPDIANTGLRRTLLRGGIGQWDGSGHAVDAAYAIPAGALVDFSCYFRLSSLAADQMLMYTELGSAAGGLGIKYDTAENRFEIVKVAVSVRAFSTSSVLVNTWHELRVIYDMTSGAYAFYIDVVAAGTGTDASVPAFDLTAFTLGRANTTQRFSGDMAWAKLAVDSTPILSYDFSYAGSGTNVPNLLSNAGTYDGTLSGDAATFWGTALEVDSPTSRNRAGYNLGLVSSGTQWIDTAETVDINSVWEIGGAFTDSSSRYLMGADGGTAPSMYFGVNASNQFEYCGSVSGNITADTSYHVFTTSKSYGLKVDGAVAGSISSPDESVSTFGLFAVKDIAPSLNAKFVMAYAKKYQSGVLTHSFVPVASGSTRYSTTPAPSNCLWDTVTETYFENAGTGSFGLSYTPRLDTTANKALPVDEQLDIYGNTLANYGSAPLDLRLASACVETNGTDNVLTFDDLSGLSIASQAGTATATITGDTLTFDAGDMYQVIFSDGTKINFSANSGTQEFDTSGNGNHGVWSGNVSGLRTTSVYQRPNNNIDGYDLWINDGDSSLLRVPFVDGTTTSIYGSGDTLTGYTWSAKVLGDDTALIGSETTWSQLPNASQLQYIAEDNFSTNPWYDGSDDPVVGTYADIDADYELERVWFNSVGTVAAKWIVYESLYEIGLGGEMSLDLSLNL
jgi:hypothetical protein